MTTLSFTVEVPSVQKATALRENCAEWLERDPDVKVVSRSMSPLTRTFTVIGVDTASKQPFSETVEATDEDAASATAVGKSKTKVVASVQTL